MTTTTTAPIARTSWDEFHALTPKEKGDLMRTPDGLMQSLVYSQQYSRELLDRLCNVAELIRAHRHDESFSGYVKTLLGTRSGVLYFTQPSTRTYTSFSLAARAVGLMCEEIRDPELSALYKGESELDTLLTLAELADTVIMRQGDHSLIERFAWEVGNRGYETRILNGGSGSEQHPTQALLELYTLVSSFDLSGDATFNVAIVGDLKRSRTARSLSYLLALYPRIRQTFIAPEELQMGEDLTAYLDATGIEWSKSMAMDPVLGDLDAIYMMRIQDEYGETSEATRKRYAEYRLTTDRAAKLKASAVILHPLPRRDELPVEIDSDPRAKYWEAVNRGKYVRMALLLHMFGKDDIDRLRTRDY